MAILSLRIYILRQIYLHKHRGPFIVVLVYIQGKVFSPAHINYALPRSQSLESIVVTSKYMRESRMQTHPLCTYAATPAYNPSLESRNLYSPAVRIVKSGADLLQRTLLGSRDTQQTYTLSSQDEMKRRSLLLRMKDATSAEDWKAAARELDVLENNEAWKKDKNSDEFDAPLIETKLKQLNDARQSGDIKQMLNLLRTSLSRDLGGMGNTELYTHSHIGTKDLIEKYIDSALALIRSVVDIAKNDLPPDIEISTILEQVICARQAFGRSALLLSGGGTFGMNHIGVLKAILDVKSLPRIISGSSAGSIVSSILCTLTDAEIPGVLASFARESNLAVFEDSDKPDSIMTRLHRLLTKGAWIDNKYLIDVMQHMIGDMTFQEAYNRTRRILNICVSSASIYELPRILNYITAPSVMIWSAIAASCSVPMIFAATSLLIKDPITNEYAPWNPTPQQWIDGSVEGDIPMTRIAEMFNVNHFIVSQVNPHVIPFLADEDRASAKLKSDSTSGWISTITQLAKDEALHRLRMLAEIGVFPNVVTKLSSVLSQKYSGHITILPQVGWKDLPLILTNPTPEFMEKALLYGERATWPKLSMIRNACAVELELDSAVQELRAQLVFGDVNQPSSRSLLAVRQPCRTMILRLKRGYTITTNTHLGDIVGSDSDDDNIENTKKINLPRNSKLIDHSLEKLKVPHTSVYPSADFSDSSNYSPHSSDDEQYSSSESNFGVDLVLTAISSPSVADFPQPVSLKADPLLATSPILDSFTSYDGFSAAMESYGSNGDGFKRSSEPPTLVATTTASISPNPLHNFTDAVPVLCKPTPSIYRANDKEKNFCSMEK